MSAMILSKRNVCCKTWKHTIRHFTHLNTSCHHVTRLKLPPVDLLSRLPVVVCGYGHCENIYYSDKSVRSARYLWPYSMRHISTSTVGFGVNVRPMTINSRLAADRLIRDMTEVERQRLSQALDDLRQEFQLENEHVDDKPTMRQLSLAAFSNSVPFVGFGFLDNAIMIAAGEYIDCTVGCALGISTMAAAAIGNMISDVAGIGLAGYVEVIAGRLGIEEPHLTAHQLLMKSTRIACYSGRALGIVIGCIIGMFPLFFLGNLDHDHDHEKHPD